MFKIGDEVEHIKLGKGTIELMQKSGEKNIYLINFESGKRHWCTDCTLKEEEEELLEKKQLDNFQNMNNPKRITMPTFIDLNSFFQGKSRRFVQMVSRV